MNPSPGPWRWDVYNNLIDAEGTEVAGDPGEGGHGVSVENRDDQALIAVAPEMRDMLLKLEWSKPDTYDQGGECPECGAGAAYKFCVHTNDCHLAALLERIR